MSIDVLLQPYQQRGVNLGLARIQQLLADLGNPQQQIPIIHVAGTNGKGSVCAYLSSVLMQAGYRVGRYISPHLVDWRERITINQDWITPQAFEQVLRTAEAVIDPAALPTVFEITTAVAWLYFAQQQVDIAVIEVGLGGRLDATNVCDRPLVSVITSISREHWQILGSTLAEIAFEKAGIFKSGCPAVVGWLPDEAKTAVQARANVVNCPLEWVAPAIAIPEPSPHHLEVHLPQTVRWLEAQGIPYPITLRGDFQLSNSALAIAAIQALRQQGWQISKAALQMGMGLAEWPARLQSVVWQGLELLVDGAHNPAAALALRQFVDQAYPQQAITWVMGMLANKDHADILTALLRPGDRLLLVPVPDHSSAEPEALAVLAKATCSQLQECSTYANLKLALHRALALQESDSSVTVLSGSLYLIGHFLGTIDTRDR
jgi:dihydrofolate synthase / folylpolyglutamate synthase